MNKKLIEKLYHKWLNSKPTTEAMRNHLRGQKEHHIDFAEYLIDKVE